MKGRILLVPRSGLGAGTGHMRRCLRLAAELAGRATLLVEEPRDLERWRADPAWPEGIPACSRLESNERWDLVLVDRRSSSRAELERFLHAGPVAALDEGGEARALACYTLDVIPGRTHREPPNRLAPEFLELPAPGRLSPPPKIRSLLATFGGEDPARLTEAFVRAAARSGLDRRLDLTVVEGSQFGREVQASGMRVIRQPPRLWDLLAQHDLVVTSYGLTAFEALAAGTPVALLNPTAYHARLSRREGLPTIGVGRPRLGRLARLLEDPGRLWEPAARLQAARGASRAGGDRGYAGLARAVKALADSIPEPRRLAGWCPVCGARGGAVAHRATDRFPGRTYYRCPESGLRYALPFSGRRQGYGASYFFEEYRAQYGRTYLEDFESIAAAGRGRVALMRGLVAPPAPVLDIGCAYGPFLVACREAGYRAVGLDVSAEAVRHVRESLGLEAFCLDFAVADLGSLASVGARCVTMWYVIEHFVDLGRVLRGVNALLPIGGVFAFSTPNGAGVSGRTDPRAFRERSPLDHYTIWEPAGARAVLERFGFTLKRIRVTGHHPERSRLLGRLGRLGVTASEILRLGDTFEAYAVKEREAPAAGEASRA